MVGFGQREASSVHCGVCRVAVFSALLGGKRWCCPGALGGSLSSASAQAEEGKVVANVLLLL